MEDCIFCKIVAGDIPAHKVYEDDDVLAFLDAHPINPGHTLVIPKQHTVELWDVPDGDYQKLMLVAKRVALKIRKELKPLKVGQAVEGLAVSHAHVHLIPIESGFEREFSKSKTDENSQESLAAMSDKLNML